MTPKAPPTHISPPTTACAAARSRDRTFSGCSSFSSSCTLSFSDADFRSSACACELLCKSAGVACSCGCGSRRACLRFSQSAGGISTERSLKLSRFVLLLLQLSHVTLRTARERPGQQGRGRCRRISRSPYGLQHTAWRGREVEMTGLGVMASGTPSNVYLFLARVQARERYGGRVQALGQRI